MHQDQSLPPKVVAPIGPGGQPVREYVFIDDVYPPPAAPH